MLVSSMLHLLLQSLFLLKTNTISLQSKLRTHLLQLSLQFHPWLHQSLLVNQETVPVSRILIGQDIDVPAELVSWPTLDQVVLLTRHLVLCSDQLSSFTRYPSFIQTITTADPTATEIEMVNVSAKKTMSSQAEDAFLRMIAEPTKSTTLILKDANAKMDMAKTH
jgi:hypothetical protein